MDDGKLCPMKAMLSSGEDRCDGEECMWFVRLENRSHGWSADGCAVAFAAFDVRGCHITVNGQGASR